MKFHAVLFSLVASMLQRAVNRVQKGRNAKQWLPLLYNIGLSVEKAQIKVGIISAVSRISAVLDDLARQGINSKGVQPWSKFLGGDGNQARYQQEISLYGKYFA